MLMKSSVIVCNLFSSADFETWENFIFYIVKIVYTNSFFFFFDLANKFFITKLSNIIFVREICKLYELPWYKKIEDSRNGMHFLWKVKGVNQNLVGFRPIFQIVVRKAEGSALPYNLTHFLCKGRYFAPRLTNHNYNNRLTSSDRHLSEV